MGSPSTNTEFRENSRRTIPTTKAKRPDIAAAECRFQKCHYFVENLFSYTIGHLPPRMQIEVFSVPPKDIPESLKFGAYHQQKTS